MNQILTIVLISWLSGFTAFLGGFIAKLAGTPSTTAECELAHGTVAFGGGLLVAAIAFALAPEGIEFFRPDQHDLQDAKSCPPSKSCQKAGGQP